MNTLEMALVVTANALPKLAAIEDRLDALATINRIACDLTLEIYDGSPVDAYIFLADRGVAKQMDKDALEKLS